MTEVEVGTILEEAIDRMTTGAGALLFVLFAVLGTVKAVALADLMVSYFEALLASFREENVEGTADFEQAIEQMSAEGLGIGLDAGSAFLLWLAAAIASLVVLAIAIDAFARDVDQPDDLGTDRLGWKTANLVAGWILYTAFVMIGAVFLLLPGALIAILLLFYPVAIVVDDEWVGAAFVSSLKLFQEHFATAAVVSGVAVLAYIARYLLGTVVTSLGGPAGHLVAELVGAVYWVFLFALLTRAYVAVSGAGTPDVVGEDVDSTGRQPA